MFRSRFLTTCMLVAGMICADLAPALAMMPTVPTTPGVAAAGAVIETVQYRRRPVPRPTYRYWRGHRGYNYYRRGYRRGPDGWWYPMAAFGLGAIIGGMAAHPPAPSITDAHIRWCMQRYRSYRAWDNTYQPYQGPRRICVSPYSR